MIDRFSRWPEVVPLEDQEAGTVARAFVEPWVARFGVPLRVTTDQGRQFESHVFKQVNEMLGTTHIRTTAYHPASNGMVERLHRQLKAALRCHKESWVKALPAVLLGIRSAWKEDLQATTAEMLYGQPLSLPGDFMASQPTSTAAEPFAKELRSHFQAVKPVEGSRHGEPKIFVFKDVDTSSHVFVRHDAVKAPLQHPYDGPYRVLSREENFYKLDINGKVTAVSISRLKPAFTEGEAHIDAPANIIISNRTPPAENGNMHFTSSHQQHQQQHQQPQQHQQQHHQQQHRQHQQPQQ